MSDAHGDRRFTGAIPEIYESHLVPLIFAPYAADLASRLAAHPPGRVLEIACGTGVVTRALAASLLKGSAIVATDLNQPMLDRAAAIGTTRPVQWRQADAMHLPFADSSFDAVVCQFGVMFFPDKVRAYAEARRVLAPSGVFCFNVWDRIEGNEFADSITLSLEALFPVDPPRFLARVPHGYHDREAIARDLASGGFSATPLMETITARSRAASPRIPAIAYCFGTPLRTEIEARDRARLDDAVDLASDAVAARFGSGEVNGQIQAHVVAVTR